MSWMTFQLYWILEATMLISRASWSGSAFKLSGAPEKKFFREYIAPSRGGIRCPCHKNRQGHGQYREKLFMAFHGAFLLVSPGVAAQTPRVCTYLVDLLAFCRMTLDAAALAGVPPG